MMKKITVILLLIQAAYFVNAQENPDSLIQRLKVKAVKIFQDNRNAGEENMMSKDIILTL